MPIFMLGFVLGNLVTKTAEVLQQFLCDERSEPVQDQQSDDLEVTPGLPASSSCMETVTGDAVHTDHTTTDPTNPVTSMKSRILSRITSGDDLNPAPVLLDSVLPCTAVVSSNDDPVDVLNDPPADKQGKASFTISSMPDDFNPSGDSEALCEQSVPAVPSMAVLDGNVDQLSRPKNKQDSTTYAGSNILTEIHCGSSLEIIITTDASSEEHASTTCTCHNILNDTSLTCGDVTPSDLSLIETTNCKTVAVPCDSTSKDAQDTINSVQSFPLSDIESTVGCYFPSDTTTPAIQDIAAIPGSTDNEAAPCDPNTKEISSQPEERNNTSYLETARVPDLIVDTVTALKSTSAIHTHESTTSNISATLNEVDSTFGMETESPQAALKLMPTCQDNTDSRSGPTATELEWIPFTIGLDDVFENMEALGNADENMDESSGVTSKEGGDSPTSPISTTVIIFTEGLKPAQEPDTVIARDATLRGHFGPTCKEQHDLPTSPTSNMLDSLTSTHGLDSSAAVEDMGIMGRGDKAISELKGSTSKEDLTTDVELKAKDDSLEADFGPPCQDQDGWTMSPISSQLDWIMSTGGFELSDAFETMYAMDKADETVAEPSDPRSKEKDSSHLPAADIDFIGGLKPKPMLPTPDVEIKTKGDESLEIDCSLTYQDQTDSTASVISNKLDWVTTTTGLELRDVFENTEGIGGTNVPLDECSGPTLKEQEISTTSPTSITVINVNEGLKSTHELTTSAVTVIAQDDSLAQTENLENIGKAHETIDEPGDPTSKKQEDLAISPTSTALITITEGLKPTHELTTTAVTVISEDDTVGAPSGPTLQKQHDLQTSPFPNRLNLISSANGLYSSTVVENMDNMSKANKTISEPRGPASEGEKDPSTSPISTTESNLIGSLNPEPVLPTPDVDSKVNDDEALETDCGPTCQAQANPTILIASKLEWSMSIRDLEFNEPFESMGVIGKANETMNEPSDPTLKEQEDSSTSPTSTTCNDFNDGSKPTQEIPTPDVTVIDQDDTLGIQSGSTCQEQHDSATSLLSNMLDLIPFATELESSATIENMDVMDRTEKTRVESTGLVSRTSPIANTASNFFVDLKPMLPISDVGIKAKVGDSLETDCGPTSQAQLEFTSHPSNGLDWIRSTSGIKSSDTFESFDVLDIAADIPLIVKDDTFEMNSGPTCREQHNSPTTPMSNMLDWITSTSDFESGDAFESMGVMEDETVADRNCPSLNDNSSAYPLSTTIFTNLDGGFKPTHMLPNPDGAAITRDGTLEMNSSPTCNEQNDSPNSSISSLLDWITPTTEPEDSAPFPLLSTFNNLIGSLKTSPELPTPVNAVIAQDDETDSYCTCQDYHDSPSSSIQSLFDWITSTNEVQSLVAVENIRAMGSAAEIMAEPCASHIPTTLSESVGCLQFEPVPTPAKVDDALETDCGPTFQDPLDPTISPMSSMLDWIFSTGGLESETTFESMKVVGGAEETMAEIRLSSSKVPEDSSASPITSTRSLPTPKLEVIAKDYDISGMECGPAFKEQYDSTVSPILNIFDWITSTSGLESTAAFENTDVMGRADQTVVEPSGPIFREPSDSTTPTVSTTQYEMSPIGGSPCQELHEASQISPISSLLDWVMSTSGLELAATVECMEVHGKNDQTMMQNSSTTFKETENLTTSVLSSPLHDTNSIGGLKPSSVPETPKMAVLPGEDTLEIDSGPTCQEQQESQTSPISTMLDWIMSTNGLNAAAAVESMKATISENVTQAKTSDPAFKNPQDSTPLIMSMNHEINTIVDLKATTPDVKEVAIDKVLEVHSSHTCQGHHDFSTCMPDEIGYNVGDESVSVCPNQLAPFMAAGATEDDTVTVPTSDERQVSIADTFSSTLNEIHSTDTLQKLNVLPTPRILCLAAMARKALAAPNTSASKVSQDLTTYTMFGMINEAGPIEEEESSYVQQNPVVGTDAPKQHDSIAWPTSSMQDEINPKDHSESASLTTFQCLEVKYTGEPTHKDSQILTQVNMPSAIHDSEDADLGKAQSSPCIALRSQDDDTLEVTLGSPLKEQFDLVSGPSSVLDEIITNDGLGSAIVFPHAIVQCMVDIPREDELGPVTRGPHSRESHNSNDFQISSEFSETNPPDGLEAAHTFPKHESTCIELTKDDMLEELSTVNSQDDIRSLTHESNSSDAGLMQTTLVMDEDNVSLAILTCCDSQEQHDSFPVPSGGFDEMKSTDGFKSAAVSSCAIVQYANDINGDDAARGTGGCCSIDSQNSNYLPIPNALFETHLTDGLEVAQTQSIPCPAVLDHCDDTLEERSSLNSQDPQDSTTFKIDRTPHQIDSSDSFEAKFMQPTEDVPCIVRRDDDDGSLEILSSFPFQEQHGSVTWPTSTELDEIKSTDRLESTAVLRHASLQCMKANPGDDEAVAVTGALSFGDPPNSNNFSFPSVLSEIYTADSLEKADMQTSQDIPCFEFLTKYDDVLSYLSPLKSQECQDLTSLFDEINTNDDVEAEFMKLPTDVRCTTIMGKENFTLEKSSHCPLQEPHDSETWIATSMRDEITAKDEVESAAFLQIENSEYVESGLSKTNASGVLQTPHLPPIQDAPCISRLQKSDGIFEEPSPIKFQELHDSTTFNKSSALSETSTADSLEKAHMQTSQCFGLLAKYDDGFEDLSPVDSQELHDFTNSSREININDDLEAEFMKLWNEVPCIAITDKEDVTLEKSSSSALQEHDLETWTTTSVLDEIPAKDAFESAVFLPNTDSEYTGSGLSKTNAADGLETADVTNAKCPLEFKTA